MPWISPHKRPLPSPGDRTLIMGIVNVTPDSFSDGGKFTSVEAAVTQAQRLVADGADVLDLGAESTRPGHAAVDAQTEIARLLPVLDAIRKVLPEVPISVDTHKAEVAEAAVTAGADIINDIWGGAHDATSDGVSPMSTVAAKLGAPIILMHNRAVLSPDGTFWEDFLGDMQRAVTRAREAGVADEQIWLDPGFGFGKTPPQNLESLRELRRLVTLGFPVLLGTSRKSTLGLVLDAPVDGRHAGNTGTVTWGIAQGAAMVRVHDVAEIRETVRMADAIRAGLRWK